MNSKIVIAKPCHENWNKMTPEEQGRHCGACNKVVQDFTKMKTEDIIETLKNSQGEVCGRIGANKLTPTNQKQKVWFWMNNVLMRKAIYPVMALLGVTLVTKKANAQVGDYPVKGKMDVRDYQTSNKKINVVLKAEDGNTPVLNANITIVSGVSKQPKSVKTDANGRVSLTIEQSNLLSDVIEIEISAMDFETKVSSIKITKDIQTVEIRMDYEMIIMGEMMFVPDQKEEIIETPQVKDTITKTESLVNIEVCKCDFKTIINLPRIDQDGISVEDHMVLDPIERDTSKVEEPIDERTISKSGFSLFPNPSADFVTIQSLGSENFNLDIFDADGKKIHAVVNTNDRYVLDLTKYSSGTYYALITVNGKAVETKKILVSR